MRAHAQVGQYARRFRFSQADHDDTSGRLKQLLRLLKKHGAANCGELLERAAEAEARLDTWSQMEGAPSFYQRRRQNSKMENNNHVQQ